MSKTIWSDDALFHSGTSCCHLISAMDSEQKGHVLNLKQEKHFVKQTMLSVP